MQSTSLTAPIVLSPAYKDYIWGGSKIIHTYQRLVNLEVCAESWEVSDREEGLSFLQNSKMSFKEYLNKNRDLFGYDRFPLLIKLIDAKESLSIQVHPSKKGVISGFEEPKSEMWHILDAQEGAQIYLGFKKNLSLKEVQEAVENETLQDHMHAINVKAGETYFVPSGLIHSIGAGCLIYEVQQNSNTTYRLYDWGRKDQNGKGRALHLKEALKAMSPKQEYQINPSEKILSSQEGALHKQIVSSSFFNFNKLYLDRSFLIKPMNTCQIYFVMEGAVKVEGIDESQVIEKGTSFILPKRKEPFTFSAETKDTILLETIPNVQ